jgi:hypothetical protein
MTMTLFLIFICVSCLVWVKEKILLRITQEMTEIEDGFGKPTPGKHPGVREGVGSDGGTVGH